MRWLKDPLIVFFIAGIVIFVAAGWLESEDISYDITVRDADLKRLNDQWAMQMRRPPSEQELQSLVDQFIREEIYYREALRIGLDANDTIVRRRLVQKLTFLTEDVATAAPADEAELTDFYDAHTDDYRLPDRFSFKHRYFSSDRRKDAQTDAHAAITDIQDQGDPFMLQKEYAGRSEREIGDLFGRDFATELIKLVPSDQWHGPVRSAYGFHAVLVTALKQQRLQTFESVRDRVAIDWQQATRKQANEQYFEALKSRYAITFPVAASP